MEIVHIRVIMLVGPPGCSKSVWENKFSNNGKWTCVSGCAWQEDLQRALHDGSSIVVNRSNTTVNARLEVYQQINEYNTTTTNNALKINIQTNVAALVFHPSSGNGNNKWNEFIGISKENYLQLPIGEMERVYRVLDMDDGVTVNTNQEALNAAVGNDWEKVHHLAECITYGPILREFKERCAVVRHSLTKHTHELCIMSYNILWQPENRCTWKDRMPTLIHELKKQAPDIVCMQEVGSDMYKDLSKQLPLYGSVLGIKEGSSFGCATFFKLDVMRMSEHVKPYDVLDKNKQYKKERVVAQILKLEHVKSKKEIVVCNTHLLYGFNPYMEQMRKGVIQRIKKIMESSDYEKLLQVICGDFNSKADSIPLKEITTGGIFLDVYHTLMCSNPEVTVEAYQHGEPIAVDYVFATNGFIPIRILEMPTIKAMRRTPLPIPGFEASDHLYQLAHLGFRGGVDIQGMLHSTHPD
jgi:endonuclease/exonuclease/phosphatase family metal-dependent hydrolase